MTVGIDAVIQIVGIGTVATGRFIVANSDQDSPQNSSSRILEGDRILDTDGSAYIATETGVPVNLSSVGFSLTSVGDLATMITVAPHNLLTGFNVKISGASPLAYSITDVIVTVIDATTFTYPIVGPASSPASGPTIDIKCWTSEVEVVSELTGATKNKPAGTTMRPEITRNKLQEFGQLSEATKGGINREDDPNASFYDLQIDANGDILTIQAFDTALLMSIFEEVRATAQEVMASQLRRGWIGNESTPNFEQGSKAWTFEQERVTGSILAELGQVVRNGFQWLIDDDLLLNVIVEQPLLLAGRVGVFVNLYRDGSPVDRRFFELWDNTGNA